MERYREYKDSGVKWLGEIPSHWEVVRFGKHFKFRKGLSITKADLIETGIAVISYGQIHAKNNLGTTLSASLVRYVSQDYLQTHPQCLLTKNDFVFADTSEDIEGSGNFVYNDFKDTIFAGYHTIIAKQNGLYNPKYYAYLFLSESWKNNVRNLVNGVKVYSIGRKQLKDNFLLFPLSHEQDAIVRYLDSATSEIDKAIAMQQKMIDLLNERKQIIIQNAVTKGLDENVEMKESGCKILGKIPTTWNVCKTLYILSMPITDGPHTTPQFYSDGIPFVSAEAVSCGNGYIDFTHIRGYISDTFYDECCKKYIPQINDIYMIKSGATTGKVAIVDTNTKFTIWSPLAVFRANRNKVLPDFLYYSLQSQYYQLQVQDKWSFGTQQNIGMRTLEKLIVCYPSIDEQSKIIEYIKNKVLKLDTAITNCQRQITLLQERKQIIINEVVTGKVRVL